MKLLGWMHRKFRQGSGEPYKDLVSARQSCSCIPGRPSSVDTHHHHLSRPSDAKRSSTNLYPYVDAAPPPPPSDLIDGLLAIGTLGAGAGLLSDEIAAEVKAEAEAEAHLEIDLKLINAELEKVLFAEPPPPKDEVAAAAAAAVEVESDGGAVTVCPLQGYLFGSPVEMAETRTAKRENHHQRTSLGELFMRAKEEEPMRKVEEVTEEKSTAVMHLVKKMKKRRSYVKGGGGYGLMSGGAAATGLENKMQKILQIFHRKVHPESPTPSKKSSKPWKEPEEVRKALIADRSGVVGAGKENMQAMKCQQPAAGGVGPFVIGGCESNSNREFWIKTDADCKSGARAVEQQV
ncbi:hypothetical protein QJS10_CPB04g00242 [Acorus calamus]|uniref:Protein LAZY 1 n=1 Tax=Acorus calamus TaxID=4465 RepID=A0AAV9F2T6_ACOCL|nr:hypothetical protein QJS10_CPB04g00242 [Acorus calamus]